LLQFVANKTKGKEMKDHSGCVDTVDDRVILKRAFKKVRSKNIM